MKQTVMVVDACQFSANYNYCLLESLARRGERIVYATTEYPYGKMPDPDGVDVWRCFFFLARAVSRITPSPALRRVLRAIEYPLNLLVVLAYVLIKRIRVVHFMWVVFPALDYPVIKMLRWTGCYVIYTAHNPFPHERRPGDVRRYCRIHRAVDRVIALTRYTRDQIASQCAVAPERVAVIPHGDFRPLFARFGTNAELAAAVRERAGARRIVAFLGLIRPYKGLAVFVDAFPLIRARTPGVYFLIAGSTHVGDERNWKTELGDGGDDLWADIRFLPVEDLKAYLSVVDVFVQPYVRASQSGNTVMAYAEGIPVISTDVGGLGEMTEDGVTGCLIAPGDRGAIADAVERCFQGENYERMSANARRAADEKFGWSAIAERTAGVYRERC
jgi:glycosyltransferase involved in cell wall biosynthesis